MNVVKPNEFVSGFVYMLLTAMCHCKSATDGQMQNPQLTYHNHAITLIMMQLFSTSHILHAAHW